MGMGIADDISLQNIPATHEETTDTGNGDG